MKQDVCPKKNQQLILSEANARTQKCGHSLACQKQIDKYVIDSDRNGHVTKLLLLRMQCLSANSDTS